MIIAAADDADIPAIADLVNLAYRGGGSGAGWTAEAHLISGSRTGAEALRRDLAGQPGALFLTLRDHVDGPLLGSVWLKPETADVWYLGLFAVAPALQDRGLGRTLLEAAEAWARKAGASRMKITVIGVRTELIAWYERRGYRRTGERQPLPTIHQRFDPEGPDLVLEWLQKPLA